MAENPPPRRWYQFRLSTILVLVAIAAWAMSLRPWATYERHSFDQGHLGRTPIVFPGIGLGMFWNSSDRSGHVTPGGLTLWVYDVKKSHRPDGFYFAAEAGNAHSTTPIQQGRFVAVGPRQLAGPIIALAALLTWKLARWIAAHWKRRRARSSS